MDKNYSSKKMPEGMQNPAEISSKLNETYRPFLEQQARLKELVGPLSEVQKRFNDEMALLASINTLNPIVDSVTKISSNINSIVYEAEQLEKLNSITKNITNLSEMESIPSVASQFRFATSGIDFTELAQEIKMYSEATSRLAESIGNFPPSFFDDVVATSSAFYNWYNSIDFSAITDAIRQQGTITSNNAFTSPFSAYKSCEKITYTLKWFPGAVLALDIRTFMKLARIVSASNELDKLCEEQIDKEIEAFFTESKINHIKNDWKNSDLDSVIIKVLCQALDAHLRGEYALTISALAPLWEGLIHKKTHVTWRQKSKLTNDQFKELVSENDYNEIFGDYYVKFIMQQCDGVDDIVEGVPNRHSIAHGWYNKYPTKKAALNAILLTDFIIRLEPKDINRDS